MSRLCPCPLFDQYLSSKSKVCPRQIQYMSLRSNLCLLFVTWIVKNCQKNWRQNLAIDWISQFSHSWAGDSAPGQKLGNLWSHWNLMFIHLLSKINFLPKLMYITLYHSFSGFVPCWRSAYFQGWVSKAYYLDLRTGGIFDNSTPKMPWFANRGDLGNQ